MKLSGFFKGRRDIIKRHILISITQKTFYEFRCNSSDAIPSLFLEKNFVLNRVKGLFKIQHEKTCKVFTLQYIIARG